MKGALLAMAILIALQPQLRLQTVEKQVGPYLVRAYFQERPRMDQESILLLQVVDTGTGTPVPRLEEQLRVEGRVVPVEGVARPVPVFLRPARGALGTYEAVFVPPAIGRYVFRILGRIEEIEVDLELETGPQGLPDILPPESDFLSPGALVGLSLLGVYLAIMAGAGLYYLRRRS